MTPIDEIETNILNAIKKTECFVVLGSNECIDNHDDIIELENLVIESFNKIRELYNGTN